MSCRPAEAREACAERDSLREQPRIVADIRSKMGLMRLASSEDQIVPEGGDNLSKNPGQIPIPMPMDLAHGFSYWGSGQSTTEVFGSAAVDTSTHQLDWNTIGWN